MISLIAKINRAANEAIKYTPDVEDKWQSPEETADRGKGDCEDTATFKMSMLESFTKCELAYVYADGVPHMILICNGYVLDNLTDEIKLLEDTGYDVVYRINESGHIASRDGSFGRAKSRKFEEAMTG